MEHGSVVRAISKTICRFGVAIGIVLVTHLLGRSKALACENSDVLQALLRMTLAQAMWHFCQVSLWLKAKKPDVYFDKRK
jgi:hypothetical protein